MAMPKASQSFPRSEYLRRLTAVKSEMKRREVEVLVVTTPANTTYLSGYTSKSGYAPQGLIVSLADEEPTFITRRMDGSAAIHQMFIDRGNVISYPEALIANPERDGYDAITEDVFQKGSQINLELSGARHGYTSPLMRTFSLGKASDHIRRLHEGEVAGLEAALAAAKTGTTCSDVAVASIPHLKNMVLRKTRDVATLSVSIGQNRPPA
ncbi:M24 family metallopeptidase [Bradyrhizobium sp. F1.13.3]|uniref:M24 family metallopeptidase n=1 Tax=Bradyrhizobium sp. F1.13.3 TaxID=3156351 RepID=UPI0033997BC9